MGEKRRHRRRWRLKRKPGKAFGLAAVVICLVFVLIQGSKLREIKSLFSEILWLNEKSQSVSDRSVYDSCMKLWFPTFQFPGEDRKRNPGLSSLIAELIERENPWYSLIEKKPERVCGEVDPAYRSLVRNREVEEEYSRLAEHLSSSSFLSEHSDLLSEGQRQREKWAESQGEDGEEREAAGSPLSFSNTTAGSSLLEKSSLPVTGKTYIAEQLEDYDYLMKHFYTVHPTAGAGREMIKADAFLEKDFSLRTENSKPQILIYHSHSQEEFSDYHSGNKEATIVNVGEYLSELLRKKGYNVIHDTSVYDLKNGTLDRSKAYTYALGGIDKILKENPSIEVVLDLHRDGVAEGTRLVREINGKPTAEVMFFNGTSQTPDGSIAYLENPNREDNLAFSFQMKLCADAFYPGYARSIYLKGLRYNLHVRPRSALIEVGAQTNTYEEARNAMEPLSEILDTVLKP